MSPMSSVASAFVEVFASRPVTGNPLSLVPEADGLDETQMRAIPRPFNQSETTFLLLPDLRRRRIAPTLLHADALPGPDALLAGPTLEQWLDAPTS